MSDAEILESAEWYWKMKERAYDLDLALEAMSPEESVDDYCLFDMKTDRVVKRGTFDEVMEFLRRKMT